MYVAGSHHQNIIVKSEGALPTFIFPLLIGSMHHTRGPLVGCGFLDTNFWQDAFIEFMGTEDHTTVDVRNYGEN